MKNSVINTAKANRLNLKEYLTEVFANLNCITLLSLHEKIPPLLHSRGGIGILLCIYFYYFICLLDRSISTLVAELKLVVYGILLQFF